MKRKKKTKREKFMNKAEQRQYICMYTKKKGKTLFCGWENLVYILYRIFF